MNNSKGRGEVLALINWFRGLILISLGLLIFYFMMPIGKEEVFGGIFAITLNLIALVLIGIGIVSLIIGYGLHIDKKWAIILMRMFRFIFLFIFLFLILMLFSEHEQLRLVAIALFILVVIDIFALWYLYGEYEVKEVDNNEEED